MACEIIEKLEILEHKARFKGLFLLLLRAESYINSSRLAKDLNVTSRTIKKDLSDLKKELQKVHIQIEAKPSFGYKLIIQDEDIEKQIKEYFQIYQPSTIDNEFDTKIQYILRRLLTATTAVKVETLQNELYLNFNNSLSKEINEVKKMLTKYSLTLVSKPYYGLSIKGKEYQKIMLTIRMYKFFDNNATKAFGIPTFDHAFTSDVKKHLKELFVKTITTSRLVFSDIYAERFIMYVIYFMNHKHVYLELPSLAFDYHRTDEFAFVEELVERLKIYYKGFLFSEEVIKFLSYIAIMSTDLYRFKDCNFEHYNQLFLKSEAIRNFIVDKMSTYLLVNMLDDYTCIKDLLKMVIPICIKVELNVSDDVDFGFYDQQRIEEKPILSHCIDMLEIDFYKTYKYTLSNREKHLILNIFEGVLNRVDSYYKKLKLAIIAVDGRLSTQQLKFNLLHYYAQYIERIDTKVLYELDSRDDWNFDYYLCSSYGKNMNISYSPIYYADENVVESEYVASLNEIFYLSFGYDEMLPKIESVRIHPKYKFEVFPIHDYVGIAYEKVVIKHFGNIEILYNFNCMDEEFRVFTFHEKEDMTMHGLNCFIIIKVNISQNFQKLKMVLSIINKIATKQEDFLQLCHTQTCSYKNIITIS